MSTPVSGRRRLLRLAGGRYLWRIATGQDSWPARCITLTQGFAPGGGVDTTAQILAGRPVAVTIVPDWSRNESTTRER